MKLLLAPFTTTTPQSTSTKYFQEPFGRIYKCMPKLATYNMDYPEQCLLAVTTSFLSKYGCPRCVIEETNYKYGMVNQVAKRTDENMKVYADNNDFGSFNVVNAFWVTGFDIYGNHYNKTRNDFVAATDIFRNNTVFYGKVMRLMEVNYGNGKKYRLCVGYLFTELDGDHPTGYIKLELLRSSPLLPRLFVCLVEHIVDKVYVVPDFGSCQDNKHLLNHDIGDHAWSKAAPNLPELTHIEKWKDTENNNNISSNSNDGDDDADVGRDEDEAAEGDHDASDDEDNHTADSLPFL
ncbi:hypothetical protein BC941DRAFT_430421 [Chlamydoabsidia padenii]|nr:hypothetical protein BC941DRAFT_430421 [Chlamydoabsidia padenii]